MASAKATASFFQHGTHVQYEQVLELYPQALRLKAEHKAKKPEELVKLDNWYQNELPKKIKSRGKDAHMLHEELVQTMKWKQIRGKYYPQLSYLVKVNTPRAVMAETKKAFRKLPNLEQAITALSNLKGVGTTMASALLAAACPESAPFMADECLLAIPDIEGIDYTTKEYLKFAAHIQAVVDRLNKASKENAARPNSILWSPHKVELALWTYYIVSDLKPELLSSVGFENGNSLPAVIHHQNGDSLDTSTSEESNQGHLNGGSKHPIAAPDAVAQLQKKTKKLSATTGPVHDEDTSTSFADNSSPASLEDDEDEAEDEPEEESANDWVGIASDSTNDSSATDFHKRQLLADDSSNSSETPSKKMRGNK